MRASGRTTSAVTQVACADAAEEVATAQQKVATLTVDSGHQADRRDAALRAIARAVVATTTTRDGECRDPDGDHADLEAAVVELHAVRDQLGPGR